MAVATGPSDKLVLTDTFPAGADLSAEQYHFVKLNTSGQVVAIGAATDIPVGILLNKPDAAGKDALVCIIGRVTAVFDASVAIGLLIGTSADGQVDAKVFTTDATEYIAGQVTLNGGAAGSRGQILINCANPHRAS